MEEKFRVRVVEFNDRAHYQLQWVDPLSGKKRTKSSGIERTGRKAERDKAERKAGDLEAELREGRYCDHAKLTWAAFRERYTSEVLASMATGTAAKVEGVFDSVESIVNPNRLRNLTAERLSFYQAELRNTRKLAESTIKVMLAHVMSAMRWAERVGLIPKAPKVDMPKRAADKMKGRPITGEEFERMLGKVESVLAVARSAGTPPAKRKRKEATAAADKARREDLARKAAPSWKHYLTGLWLSGLRLGESLDLYWDRDDKLRIDLSGKRPMLWIPAALEKGNKDRLLPLSPEFAEFLLATPEAERTGPVFKLHVRRNGTAKLGRIHVSAIVCLIGERAGVKVGTKRNGKPKFASAHDLRRSFGERWAVRVMPQVLMELMRHEDISTTMGFYVGRNAERTADVLWAAHAKAESGKSNTFGNTTTFAPVNESGPDAISTEAVTVSEKLGDKDSNLE